jgi:hypothetical protein
MTIIALISLLLSQLCLFSRGKVYFSTRNRFGILLVMRVVSSNIEQIS